MSDRFEAVAVTVAICTALLAATLAVLLATLPLGENAPPASGGPSAACMEWSDGCVVCARSPEGLACSTPGIACTRGPTRCLRP
jgi:hypothetical protein